MNFKLACTERLEYNYRLKVLLDKPDFNSNDKETMHDMTVLIKLKAIVAIKDVFNNYQMVLNK